MRWLVVTGALLRAEVFVRWNDSLDVAPRNHAEPFNGADYSTGQCTNRRGSGAGGGDQVQAAVGRSRRIGSVPACSCTLFLVSLSLNRALVRQRSGLVVS